MTQLIRRIADMLVNVLLVVLILAAVPLLAGRFMPGGRLPLIGGYRVLVIQGGSMEPSIKLGSVIVIRTTDPKQIEIGDVITFHPPENGRATSRPPAIATHRVVEVHRERVYGDVERISFRTKGDANEEPDMQLISGPSVMGKVVLTVPRVGYLIRFAKTPLGLALMVLLPGLVLVTGGFVKVMPWARARRGQTAATR